MKKHIPPMFYQMLQSYVALATTLNLSKAVEKQGTARQTIRRHITELERLCGEKFLVFDQGKFAITPAGIQALETARELLEQAKYWLVDRDKYTRGLRSANLAMDDGVPFYAQRHPMLKIWTLAPPMLQKGLQAWCVAAGQIDHQAFDLVRPYVVIYRRHKADWICAKIGNLSSYATWLGMDWAKSAIGANFFNDPISSKSDEFILQAYEHTAQSGSIWYDHVSTKFPRIANGELAPVNYQRFIFSCVFPNGDPAVASLVARTNNITLDHVDPALITKMRDSDLMEFDL